MPAAFNPWRNMMSPKTSSFQTSPRSLPLTLLIAALVLGLAPVASAQPIEVCDGVDNNGDGQIDEGFDVDGDGVARCCWDRDFFATTTNANQQIEVHYNFCSNSTFVPGITPAFDDPSAVIQLHAVGDFDQDPGRDIIWRDVGANWGQRNITTCKKGEWITQPLGGSDLAYFGGADLDLDGDHDLVGWHADCCPVNAYAGTTALNASAVWPSFSDLYSTYDISPLQGAWGRARVYNLEDMTNDGRPDLLYWEYATGGASPTELHFYQGNGAGSFVQFSASMPNAVPGQPQNFGDMGDINGDGCTDWVGGPDDDGDKGGVYARRGDCFAGTHSPPGSFSTPAVKLVDTCDPNTSCPGSGVPGMGMSQLYDWDCDGDLDLLTSRRLGSGTTADVLFWENGGGGIFSSIPVTAAPANPSMSTKIASPLRH